MKIGNGTGLLRDKLSQKLVNILNNDDALFNLVDNYSIDVATDGETIRIPVFGDLGDAKTLADGATAILDDADTTDLVLNVNVNIYKAFSITKRLLKASHVSPMAYFENAATSLKVAINRDILSQVVNADVTVGDVLTDLTEQDFVDAKTVIDRSFAGSENRYAVISPDQANGLLLLEGFRNTFLLTAGKVEKRSANVIGEFHGFTIIKNNDVTNDNLFFQKEAIAAAKTQGVEVATLDNVLGKKYDYLVDTVYGVKTKISSYMVNVQSR